LVNPERVKRVSSLGTQAEAELRQQQTLAQQLQESEARLALAVRGGRLGLWDWDLRSGHCTFNERWASMLGYALDEIEPSASAWEKLLHPDDKARIQPILEANLRGEASFWTWEQRLRHKDGHWVWILGAGAVVERAPDGTPLRAAGTHADITEQKEAEEAAAHQEKELRTFLDAIPIPAFRKDAESRWLLGNRALFETVGKSAEACLGKTDLEIFGDPAIGEAVIKNDRRILASGIAEVIEEEIQTPEGPRIFHATKVPYRDPDGRVIGIVGAALDVTDRRRAEEALRASEARFRGLFESLMDGFVVMGMDGFIRESNEVYRKMVGYSAEEFAHLTYKDLTPERWHPVEARIITEQVLPRGYSDVYEKEYRRKDGTVFPVEFRTFLLRVDGRPDGMWAIVRDVTETRALQAKLTMASRLAAMGTLVSGVAHEINNPLAAEMADQGMALEVVREVRDRLLGDSSVERAADGRALADAVEALEDAMASGERIAQIVKDLSVFGRPGAQRQRARLIDIIDGAMRWLPATVAGSAAIQVVNDGAPDVMVSAGQIEQILVNLITNAAKAVPEGQRDTVIVRVGPGLPGMARVEVIDHGSGIDPAIRDSIFDPFFTTRPAGPARGTGLGLAICHAIATGHGGTLTFESEVGKGSTFRVELPAAPAEA
jgi:PAS domain S-box-containing protein